MISLKKWFKNNIKIIFSLLFIILYIIWIVFIYHIIAFDAEKRMDVQYNKILKTIEFQENSIFNDIKLVTNSYVYAVDSKKVLEDVVNNNMYIKSIIDYKPLSDVIDKGYPEKFLNNNLKLEIKNKIKDLEKGKYIKFNTKDSLFYIMPYFYKLIENQEIFQGLLIFEIDKDSMLNQVKEFLLDDEKIVSTKPIKNFFIKYKEYRFYSTKYYYVISFKGKVYTFFYLSLILFFIVIVLYYIIKTLFVRFLEKNMIEPVKDFSEYIRESKVEPYNKEFKIVEFENMRKAFNEMIIKMKNNKIELESAYEETNAMNEELIETNKKLEQYIKKFESIIKIIGNMSLQDFDEKKFFDEFLKLSIDMIPEVKYGSIVIKENKNWKFISTYGHNFEILKHVVFPEKNFIYAKKSKIVEDIISEDKILLDNKNYKMIKEATIPIKKSILVPLKINDIIIGQIALDTDREVDISEESVKLVETLSIISSVFIRLKRVSKEEGKLHKNIILALIKALEYYDKYTKGHSERVAKYSTEFAEFINLSKEKIKKLYWSSITHDIGKFFIPQTILNKPGKLNDEEYEIIKEHPVKSYELLSKNEYLNEFSIIVRHHHERWDGTGYPDGLKEENIPYFSRIISLADSFDAMRTERPYKKEMRIDEIIEEIRRNAGTQFDPILSSKFIEFLRRKYL
ncbi:HD domain-containing protein [Marinitoga hydrogenitolerans DSM 16785]|uniref:HD domain-containing protein n=1 Tax=Marinitoga hydrogenitolerans (strain DSM 16785 / JCM 12826 / AT1271) TaxID=1122195 RepID=A0A1M4VNF1_MARH1|nr:HD-GYP domain-containing protein [Marinitoga hydrogenitolerans]SHE70621.1 HD domain-containing protein [Marinitoga hydrogenitolerans DSM 16785]